jgi:hypothetical protein
MSATKIHPLSVVCATNDLPFFRLHNDLLAIDERGGYCYSLNPSAARIWELIPKPTPVKDICAALYREFVVDEAKCQEEVMEFLGALAEAGLVKVAG